MANFAKPAKPSGPTQKRKSKDSMMSKKKPSPMGGVTGKPKPQKPGVRILPGTGSVTKQQTMPELRKSGGVGGAAVKPKATPKPKYTLLPRKITPKRTPRMGNR